MSRAKIIQAIKILVPGYKSKRTDTLVILQKKLDEVTRKPLPYLSQITSSKLIKFLKTPEDQKTFITTADDLIKNIKHYSEQPGFLLLMTFSETRIHYDVFTQVPNGEKTIREVHRFLTNLDEADELGKDFDTDFDIDHAFHGSDIEELVRAMIVKGAILTLKWLEKSKFKKTNSGAYFKYFNKSNFNLKRYQIFSKSDDSEKADRENCLIYAFKQCKEITSAEITSLKMSLFHKEVKLSDLKKIASQIGIEIRCRYDPSQSEVVHGKGFKRSISIGLVDNHWFINEPTKVTKFAIEYHDDIINGKTNDYVNKQLKSWPKIQPNRKSNQKGLNSFNVIHSIFKNHKHLLEPITLENLKNKNSTDQIIEYNDLRAPVWTCKCGSFDYEAEKSCDCVDIHHEAKLYDKPASGSLFKGYFKKDNPNDNYDIWFFDSETCLHNGKHVPYLICATRYHGVYNGKPLKLDLSVASKHVFSGLDCAKQLFDQLTRNAVMYAHNAAFDFSMIVDQLYDLTDIIQSGSFLKSVQAKARNARGFYNNILIKDSYSFLTCSLSKIPDLMDLQVGDKDVFPHKLINVNNFDKLVSLSECLSHLNTNQHEDFIKNAKKQNCLIDDKIDLKIYSEAYCIQDVNILSEGFLKIRKQIYTVTEFDIIGLLSTPQLSDSYMKKNGVYDGCYAISGIANDFIRRCCIGGRVMVQNNQKIKVDESNLYTTVGKGSGCINHQKLSGINSGPIADFDAVSLYGSAMYRLASVPMGIPKVITSQTDLSSVDSYYVEIEVTECNNWRSFPLQSVMDGGIRNFTNDIVGKRLYVDNIALEDLVKYQDVSYKIIRGLYYNDGLNTRLKDIISFMFNERLKLKSVGNKLEAIYKLLMNSSYGKLIQKPINTIIKFMKNDTINKYVVKNHKFVKSWSKVNDDMYVIKEAKSINEHFSCPHIASLILSMSKRLMNEVICTAEDLGISVYYQDTDSMHIHEASIPILSDKFKAKYDRELIGKSMCQFHSDFSVSDKSAKNIRSTEAIFLGKKCYFDSLKYEDKDGITKSAVHIRMKGIPSKAVSDAGDPINTYNRLFNNETMTFGMEKYIPLQKDQDYAYRANTRCISRTLKFY